MAKLQQSPWILARPCRNGRVATTEKPAAFLLLAKLPRTPASDLEKLGWRGMMGALRSKGTLLVTNHDEPEAVTIPVAVYDALMQLVKQPEAQTEAALAGPRLRIRMVAASRMGGLGITREQFCKNG